jgi:UDP-N-acetylglucosamine 1-carboxyvinyltransferase
MTVAYKITGGSPLKGEITCLGAKNFATKAMVAACLSKNVTKLTNVPAIGDVEITEKLLTSIGVKVKWASKTELEIDPSKMNTSKVKMPDSRNNRIPILLLPILLHRFGKASVPVVGGCEIGERKVDFHTSAAENFGADIICDSNGYTASVEGRLQGAHFKLGYPSVGATETCLFLSVLAEGTSVINNAAIEPEIIELITMLRSMGAIIFLKPNREIRIEGVEKLHGTMMPILGDRIEAASWASLACATDGDITVHGIRPNTLGNYLSYFQQVGGGYEFVDSESIRFFRASELKPTTIETDVYPGFSTDWQQPFAALLTQAKGVSVIHETVYESRFGYMKALNKLGAKTQLTTQCLGKKCRFADHNHNHSALIMGKTPLKAIAEPILIPDLRAGLAYVIAAAIADGTSLLTGVELLERGYGDVCAKLKGINLEIERVSLDGKADKNWFAKVIDLKSHKRVS